MEEHSRASERSAMVDEIARHFAATRGMTGVSGMSDRLREALLRAPRHRFVPSHMSSLAYTDSALPIGYGQTISQPFIVALMTELARVDGESRVLEVGTGSGYQAAVLSEVAREVYSIELVPELAESASALLADAGYGTVEVRCGDGFAGWPEAAPFDAILVTACASEAPAPLLDQLAVGGRMVIPIGRAFAAQALEVHVKRDDGTFVIEHNLPVAFVPFVHDDRAGSQASG